MADCRVDGCPHEAGTGGICAAHRKRLQRGGQLDAPVAERLSPFERAMQAALDLADADTTDDAAYARAVDRFRKAAERWIQSLAGRRAAKSRWNALSLEARQQALLGVRAHRWPKTVSVRAQRKVKHGSEAEEGHPRSEQRGQRREGALDQTASGQTVPEGRESEPRRRAGAPLRDPSPDARGLAGGAGATGGADAVGGRAGGRARVRGGARPGRAAAVRRGAGEGGADR